MGIGKFSHYSTVQYSIVEYSTVQYCTILYCTVLYCTLLYCTVLYCNEKICQYIGIHSGNDYFGFITANILEINNRGDRGDSTVLYYTVLSPLSPLLLISKIFAVMN